MAEEKKVKVEKEVKEDKVEARVEEKKVEEKKVVKAKEIPKKDAAVARGVALRVSPKQCIYVCRIIRGKSPDAAVARLQDVIDEGRAVPMAGLEVGHKKGKGLAGGRFPKTACKAVMDVVKQAAANAVVAGIDEPVIVIAKADAAAAPLRRGGRKAKRCHVYIEVKNREVRKK
jgi:large subunit ribosomal protein L22